MVRCDRRDAGLYRRSCEKRAIVSRGLRCSPSLVFSRLVAPKKNSTAVSSRLDGEMAGGRSSQNPGHYKKCSIFTVKTIISMSVTCVTAYDGGSKVGNRIPWLTEGRELRSRDPGPILATWIGKWQECGFSAQVWISRRANPSPKGIAIECSTYGIG